MRNNIGSYLTKRAHLSPLIEGAVEPATGRRFTFAELNARCNKTANALTDLGVKPGDRVALLLMNSVEFMESFFALAKLGAVCVPLNWRLVPAELEFILTDSGCTVLLFGSDFAAVATELHDAGAATPVGRWIQIGDATAPFAADYNEITTMASNAEPPEIAGGDDLMFIMYTSGTTGLPKGVMHSHETVTWALITISQTADLEYGDRYLVALPLFHVGALSPLIANVYNAATSVILRAFDPKVTWEIIRDERVTVMLAVPAMLNFMLQVYDASVHDVSSLRWVMSGAAPVPVTLIKAYEGLDIEIHQVYGLTETCGPACLISPEDALSHAGSTGKPFFHTDVRVVNDDGTPCGPDEPGEVLVAGPHIMVGYWNRPDATTESIRDGWLWTGDVATMDADGFVTIMDRTKDMLISGGENVYPAEIENVVLSHPGVADVAVIGLPSAKWGECPLAVVVRKDEALTADDVMAWCRGKLAPFKLVKAVEFVTEIPRNPTGKILKRVLRETYSTPVD